MKTILENKEKGDLIFVFCVCSAVQQELSGMNLGGSQRSKSSSLRVKSKQMFTCLPLALFMLLVVLNSTSAIRSGARKNNRPAMKPPMGWLNWERFMCETDCQKYPRGCVNEQLYLDMATRLVEDGYQSLGYTYVNIDDCWSLKTRDGATEQLVPDPERFPNGISGLAASIHAKGLKLGIYGDCGLKTCAGYPGQVKLDYDMDTNNYFELDSTTLTGWQIDSFKFDGCFIDPIEAESVCSKFLPVLQSKGREVLLVCEWPFYMMKAHAEPTTRLPPRVATSGATTRTSKVSGTIEDQHSLKIS